MSETKQAETRAIWTSDEVVKLCADARRSTAKEIAQRLRMYARTCGEQKSAALAYEAAANEIERDYEVSL